MPVSALILGLLLTQAPAAEVDERLLREHRIATDDAGLLDFFRERTLAAEQVAELKAKMQRLGSTTFSVRTRAAQELVKAGLNARALLLDTIADPATDLEIARRAELCLRQIAQGQEIPLSKATARLLAQRRPADAAQVLIAFVPFAGDPQILEAVQGTLDVVAVRDGRADPAVLQAVRDAHAGKRAVAGVALIRAGGLKQKAAVSHLLQDKSAKVRLPLTLALVEAKDKDAVPILIERLADEPTPHSWQVTELLERIAGDKAPAIYADSKTPTTKVRDAWQAWWTAHAAGVDLAKLSDSSATLGYTLITMMGTKGTAGGKVVELRPDRSVHWEIDNLSYPLDARIVGPNRVLITEYIGRRVTERDFQGNILWEFPIDLPIAAQRLPGGETFIVSRRQLLVVDSEKRTTFSHTPAGGLISTAYRMRDGHMVFVNSTGQCYWLDPQGRELKSFPVGYVYTLGGSVEVLPNRHLLVPLYRDGKIAEFDGDGKMVWHLQALSPTSATRLPNGHLLGTSLGGRTNEVVELDRDGRTVWTYAADGRAMRARGR